MDGLYMLILEYPLSKLVHALSNREPPRRYDDHKFRNIWTVDQRFNEVVVDGSRAATVATIILLIRRITDSDDPLFFTRFLYVLDHRFELLFKFFLIKA